MCFKKHEGSYAKKVIKLECIELLFLCSEMSDSQISTRKYGFAIRA